jgi:hypothetical protein
VRERLKAWGRTVRTAFIVVCLSALVAGAALTTLSGVAIVNSTGAFTALSDSALSSGCVGNSSGTFTSNANCLSAVNVYEHVVTLASNIGVGTGNTPQQISAFTIPALPALCGTNGCRIRVRYAYPIYGGVEGYCWAEDTGTSTPWALGGTSTSSNFSVCQGGGELSPSQYSAGSTPTISSNIIDSGTITVCAATQGSGSPCTTAPSSGPTINGQMILEVVPSN